MVSAGVLVGFTLIHLSASDSRELERIAEASEKASEAAALSAERTAVATESIARILAAIEKNSSPPPKPTSPPVVLDANATSAPPSAWSGSIGAGLIFLAGNSSTTTFNAQGNVEHKTLNWIFSAKTNALYGETRIAGGPPITTALAAGLQLREDRRFSSLFSVYGLSGVDTDHIKSVEYRVYGEAGTSILWLDHKKAALQEVLLRTDIALRYAREARFQYQPTALGLPAVDLVAPRFGLSFRYALSAFVAFSQDAEALPNLIGTGRVLVNTLTKLSSRLIGPFALGASFAVNYDSLPAAGKLPTDAALGLTLDALL